MARSTKLAFAALAALCCVAACSGGNAGNGQGGGNGNDAGIDAAGDGGQREGSASDAQAGPETGGDDGSADGGAPSACGVPFSRTGPWCYKLAAATPVAPNSAAVVANIQADIKNNYGTFGINTDTYSSPIYTVTAATPKQNWTYCPNMGSLPAVFAPVLQNVPTDSGMLPSMGTDSEITLYDPQADQEWEFWVAVDNGGKWSACWGGTIVHVSTDPGIFPSPLGATACGLPLLGFLMRMSELQAGLIQHAVNIAVVRTQAGSFSWPANRTDGNTADPDTLMEGQRLRLDPTFDVSSLPNAAERTIAKAMQDYGMLLTDTSGAVDMQAEDPRPYMAAHNTTTNPYDAIFAGRPSYQVLADIPIDRLQVLPKDYGKSFMH